MFTRNKTLEAELNAIRDTLAVIEFKPDGTIITANRNFLEIMGYTLPEIQGKHHRIFMDPTFAASQEYEQFWHNLRYGKAQTKQCKKLAKSGKEIWTQTSYIPVLDSQGKLSKIINISIETTVQTVCAADYKGKIEAINKSQAIIEFRLDGTIITANENFLNAVGYTLAEIQGKHHRIFVSPEYAQSQEYKQFWEKLGRGEFDTGEYQRFGKGGKEIWIQASYNLVTDDQGRPVKVIKFASDITAEKLKNAEYETEIKFLRQTHAVIEFTLEGNIITANDIFLKATGYTLKELQGQHHSLLVEPEYARSEEYKQFWDSLRNGKFSARVYKRIAKSGQPIWLQAYYNPILNTSGKPFKVVKFANDVTNIINTADMADDTNNNLQNLATAAEEMATSITEISKNMTFSQQATNNILERTQTSSISSERLIDTMKSMGTIVELISSIASQVNLLALNATIEAARAGDMGRGFAVVAAEVKELAGQTARATEDIAKEISTVQSIAAEVAKSVKEIIDAANLLNQYVSSVASAIEEQGAATKEISANTQRSSQSVADITHNIRQFSEH